MMLTAAQQDAIQSVATAFGWDKMDEPKLRLLMWSAFHYYVMRLK